eukprot:GHRR01012448.1.p1 GENE.GHRR01012448.1~~GHRR01012448.1.p1  ORF type:complete len:111 (+),score=13.01 GHRR01012448.1:452-784(+)
MAVAAYPKRTSQTAIVDMLTWLDLIAITVPCYLHAHCSSKSQLCMHRSASCMSPAGVAHSPACLVDISCRQATACMMPWPCIYMRMCMGHQDLQQDLNTFRHALLPACPC